MSAHTATSTTMPSTSRRAGVAGAHLTFARLVRAEVVKITSLASTYWIIGITVAVVLGISWLFGVGMGGDLHGAPDETQATAITMFSAGGLSLGYLVLAVLGVVAIGSEYASGMIRTTYTAAPRRVPALLAKAVVLAAVSLLVGALSTVGSFLIIAAMLSDLPALELIAHPGVPVALAGGTAFFMAVTLLALGVAASVRNTAAGIAIVVGVLFVLPVVLAFVPSDWAADVSRILPSSLASDIYALNGTGFEVWQALLIMAAWVAAAWVPAIALTARRDV